MSHRNVYQNIFHIVVRLLSEYHMRVSISMYQYQYITSAVSSVGKQSEEINDKKIKRTLIPV